MSKLLCIFPVDNTTSFLRPIVESLEQHLGDGFICISVYSNNQSFAECIEKVKDSAIKSIIYLGHGGDGYLQLATHEDLNLRIDTNNIIIFKNKRVFSLSCNSNKKLGSLAQKNACEIFIGFGDIPTDFTDEDNSPFPRVDSDIIEFKSIITDIICRTLIYGINNLFSFHQMGMFLKVQTNNTIQDIANSKHHTNKKWLIYSLFSFKDNMTFFGDPSHPFISSE